MILDIDAGNSRTKWRVLKDDAIFVRGISVGSDKELLESIDQAIASESSTALDVKRLFKRVRVASVRDAEKLSALASEIQSRWQLEPKFAATSASACGVKNSYQEPQTMGVDRWCAMVGAANLAGRSQSFCVIDAGSAITLDLVDAQGVHLGGHIAPGFALQLHSLLSGTDRIFVDGTAQQMQLTPADNTSDAVLSGVLLTLCGMIEKVIQDFNQQTATTNGPLKLFITGGDAVLLQHHLSLETHYIADLVLDGLGFLLP